MGFSFARTVVPALLFATSTVVAQEPARPSAPAERNAAEVRSDYWQGRGMGPGMMGGYAPGRGQAMTGGYAPGQGAGMMGHGMMGPGMMGPGMMGPGMMGPGMMGPGMMGPGMMGHGMMGGVGHALSLPGLDDAQRKQILQATDELRRKHWETAGQMHEEMAKLRDASWPAGKRDRAAILAAHKRLSELRLQQIESSLDATERIEKLLTAEQREQLERVGPGWATGGTP